MEEGTVFLLALAGAALGICWLYILYRAWKHLVSIAENTAKIERHLRNIGETSARTEACARSLAATVPYIEANTRALQNLAGE